MRHLLARTTMAVLLATAALGPAATGAACRRGCPRNLEFGRACDADCDCESGICLFQRRTSRRGVCTQQCRTGSKDACPQGTACTTLADHAGGSITVCGEPPPILGPQGPPPPGATPREPPLPPGVEPRRPPGPPVMIPGLPEVPPAVGPSASTSATTSTTTSTSTTTTTGGGGGQP